MRTTKFRVWDKERKEWVKDKFYIGNDSILFDCEGKELVECDDPERFVICQYTGLEDKNGVEIYEGDVLKLEGEGDDSICFIVFEEFAFRRSYGNAEGWEDWMKKPVLETNDVTEDGWHVVGNIYENPELLK